MYGRIVKSEHILTKLRVLDYEYICDRIAKFCKKILFITRVINIQILTTKYFSFQYSVTYCSQALGVLPISDGVSCCEHSGTYRSALRWSRDKSQRPVGLLSRYFASSTATASHSWSVWRLLYFSTGQRSCSQSTWDSASVNSWNTRLHHSSSVAS